MKWITGWKVRHIRNGKVIWEMEEEGNVLHDTGEIAILSAFFATGMANYGSPPANHYLGLDARESVAEEDTLADLTGEPTGLSGYSRKALSSAGTGASGQDFYINQPATYYRADSKVVEWTAGEIWTAVTRIFLCTHATATEDGDDTHLICTKDLTASRTLQSGDKLQASMYIGLSE